jgi:hypothetical protein
VLTEEEKIAIADAMKQVQLPVFQQPAAELQQTGG